MAKTQKKNQQTDSTTVQPDLLLINVNAHVFFRLRPEGYALLQKYLKSGEGSLRKLGFIEGFILGWRKQYVVAGTEGPHQIYRMQLWELMRIFGPGYMNGAQLFVDGVIALRREDLSSVEEF